MQGGISREDGHLIVAAVRVLDHRLGHPPTVEEIAELLDRAREWTGVIVSGLEAHGVVATVKSAFTHRVEIRDYRVLETLDPAAEQPTLGREMEAFHEKRTAEEEALGDLFGGGRSRRKRDERMDDLSDRLKGFRSRSPKKNPLFPDDADDA
jgi:hypothetical protein